MAKLTQAQRKIVRGIRELHKAEEPLNITAVKRRHPGLIKAVYRVKPFWGWRCALRDAGIDDPAVGAALRDYVSCRICRARMASLLSHLYWVHGIDCEEYHTEYP